MEKHWGLTETCPFAVLPVAIRGRAAPACHGRGKVPARSKRPVSLLRKYWLSGERICPMSQPDSSS